ncbi:hypothetical protein ACFX2A_045296 [Malus domestica]
MAGAASNDQALSLLATVNNHGDLAVKLSSLKQAKDLLLSLEPSFVAVIFTVCLVLPHYDTVPGRLGLWVTFCRYNGSAHRGPALTPAEVLITDACSACFEQRTVFTQALAKALNQMVDQTPLPLLFMRTVIQAIDDFPSLVDFVMEILSKLVRKLGTSDVLYVRFGFLKCASQTQPHSFHELLRLPPPQPESTLNKYANLRGPLAAYASQPSVKASLYRYTIVHLVDRQLYFMEITTLADLGLENETHLQQPHVPPSLYLTDTSSSVHGADSNVIITKQHKLINSWSNSYVIIRKRSDSQK